MTSKTDWAFRADFLEQQAEFMEQQADIQAKRFRDEASKFRVLARSARMQAEAPDVIEPETSYDDQGSSFAP